MLKSARENARGHHRWSEPGTFFICPVYDLDWCKCFIARVMQCPQRFKCAEDPKRSVELSSRWLRVEVTTHCNRGQIRPLTRSARKHRAHIIDRNYAAQFFSPCLEPVAHLPIEISQCESANTTFRSTTNRCCLH